MSSLEESRIIEAVRLIEADHKSTSDFIARISTLRTATRGVVIPLASALAGLALANKSWVLAVVGVPVVVVSLASEVRWDFLVHIAHNRLITLEYKIQSYLNYLLESGTVAADAKTKLFHEVDTYQFGNSRSLRGMSLRTAVLISFKTAIFWLHAVLIAALILIGVFVGWNKEESKTRTACVLTSTGTLVEVSDLPVPVSGQVKLVPCP